MFKRLPISFLILSNLVPIAGVLVAGWDAASIVLVYWAENLVIGLYNILKMLTVAPFEIRAVGSRLFYVLFFALHYGGFAAGHGMFLLGFFDIANLDQTSSVEQQWPGPLVLLQMLFGIIVEVWRNMPQGFGWALAALFISHGVSFLYNFVIDGERNRITVKKLMGQPYSRVVIMHVAIIAGGFLVDRLGSPVALLLALVAAKIVMDLMLHKKSHKGMHDAAAEQPASTRPRGKRPR